MTEEQSYSGYMPMIKQVNVSQVMEMINTYLETLGVKALYLGNNLPIRSLENTIKEIINFYAQISKFVEEFKKI